MGGTAQASGHRPYFKLPAVQAAGCQPPKGQMQHHQEHLHEPVQGSSPDRLKP